MSLKESITSKWAKIGNWVKFGLATLLYVLWVIWLGNYWWLFGLLVIFDLYITKKVKWTFWKKEYKKGEKRNALLDWLDAIIFAVVVVTFINIFFFQAFKIPSSSMESSLYTGDHLFVSKLSYGPKMPQTPLTIPFTHNVIAGKESYSKLIQSDYKRLKGFGSVKRGDCVVFNFPNGDTVLKRFPADDYYMLCRIFGRKETIKNYGPIVVRPSDKKDHYVKRCVAIAGDTLLIKNGSLFVNGEKTDTYPGLQNSYKVVTNGQRINSYNLDKLGINTKELWFDAELPGYPAMPLTEEMLKTVKTYTNVLSIEMNEEIYPMADSQQTIFPFSIDYKWTRDNFGPLWIPQKGVTISLDTKTLPLYARIISSYEGHDLKVVEDKIMIDGSPVTTYTFEQDYYFMMGDNRHNSLDSRYWGFVPEDHIVGKPSVIWLSIDGNKKFPKNIRWRRFLKFV